MLSFLPSRRVNARPAVRRIQENGMVDVSSIVIQRDAPHLLPFSDDQLQRMTDDWCAHTLRYVPGFSYWALDESRRMDRPENITGYQQRAFDFYWQILVGAAFGGVCLGIGTSSCAGPATLGTDKYCGVSPDVERYGESYGYAHMTMDADRPFPFHDRQFNAVMANHVIEHMIDPVATLAEMLRVCKLGGVVCLVTPDMAYSNRGSIDPTHTVEFSADTFFSMLEESRDRLPAFDWLEFNTFDNAFSFNVVLKRL